MSTIAQKNNELITLIDKAATLIGSEYRLAQALGIPPQTITGWKAGRRTCTPPDRARLAAMANEDAVQELVRATLANTAGTLRGEQLQSVLGKWLRATGETAGGVLPSLTSLIFSTAWLSTSLDLPRCIKRQLPRFNNC